MDEQRVTHALGEVGQFGEHPDVAGGATLVRTVSAHARLVAWADSTTIAVNGRRPMNRVHASSLIHAGRRIGHCAVGMSFSQAWHHR